MFHHLIAIYVIVTLLVRIVLLSCYSIIVSSWYSSGIYSSVPFPCRDLLPKDFTVYTYNKEGKLQSEYPDVQVGLLSYLHSTVINPLNMFAALFFCASRLPDRLPLKI